MLNSAFLLIYISLLELFLLLQQQPYDEYPDIFFVELSVSSFLTHLSVLCYQVSYFFFFLFGFLSNQG